VIAEVAKRLRTTLPADALVGRLGGEEFAALLASVTEPALHAIAEQLRTEIAGLPIAIGVLGPLACTVSIGIAMGDDTPAGIDDLLAHADDALYRAKRSGRNRVVAWVAGSDPSPRPSQIRRRDDTAD